MTPPCSRHLVTLSDILDRMLGAELAIGGRKRRSKSRLALQDGTPSSHNDTQPSFFEETGTAQDESRAAVFDETETQTSHTVQTSADNSPTAQHSARQMDAVDDMARSTI